MKLNYKKTLLLGFGFLSISLTWALYNSFVPIFLRKFIVSNGVIGFIMTLDNYAGLFLQPIFGTLSDRTRTRFGRRIPYLLIGMPIAALFLCIIPWHWSLISLVFLIVCLNLDMASFRSPTIALMPDLTPGPLRSKANGVINLMGGLGSVIAYFIGSKLYSVNKAYPFYMAAVFMLISLAVLYKNIKERRDALNYDDVPVKIEEQKEDSSGKLSKNVVFLLIAIFFWFVAFNPVEAFFTLYGKYFLNVNEAVAASKLTYFSLSMMIFAVPAGIIATKIGKKKTIITGLILMILLFAAILNANDINTIGYIFIFAGFCWALININSYPLVVSMTTGSNIGKFTGFYYIFSALAAIVSPPVAGGLIDIFGYDILFKISLVGFILALIFISLVKPPAENNIKGKASIEDSLENLDV